MEIKEEWSILKKGFWEQLIEIKYSPSYMKLIKNTLSKLDGFITNHNEGNYSVKIGERFLQSEVNLASNSYYLQKKSVINRLNDFCAGRTFKRVPNHIKIECPPCFQEYLNLYVQELILRGLKTSSITRYQRMCIEGLVTINKTGISKIEDIKANSVLRAFELSNDKPVFVTAHRSFLKFLYKVGFLEKDLSLVLPSIKRPQLIPTIYSIKETVAMIDKIDRTTKIGKRDYAVILLALRLGMRRGDIANLKLENVDFQYNRIRFVQEKTGIQQNLPLSEELKMALNDYIHTARPESNLPFIFLKINAPITRLFGENLYASVSKYLKKAGIDSGNRKRGPHSLRMTFASELISGKVPYGIVRYILGQEDPESTKHYVKFDFETLRTCALVVPKPIGFLSEILNSIGGGTL